MDAFDLFIYFLLAIVVLAVIFAFYVVFQNPYKQYLKDTAPTRNDFQFLFKNRIWNIKCPVLNSSIYWDRFPKNNDWWEYMATLDCYPMRELANELKKIFEGKSNEYKAEFILAMVQQNCRYVSDPEQYGMRDRHAFPVCTAYLKKGDCEDSAVLGACLSSLCGLDTILCLTPNHMGYAVAVNGDGYRVNFGGKSYLWCETTSINKIGKVNNKPDVRLVYVPLMPSTYYVEDYTEADEFYKYLDESRK